MKINKEGYKIIGITGLICLLLGTGIYRLLSSHDNGTLVWVLVVLMLLFWFFIVAFFREPRRVKIHDADLVFSPVVRLDDGRHVLFRQIAGLIARRIVSYMKVGERVKQNDVCGFIKFGSRIDVLLPKDSEVLVEIGDPVVGSQTPITRLKPQTK